MLFPWERCTTVPANTIQLARCSCPTAVCSHKRAEPAIVSDRWLKPVHAQPHALKGRRLAAGYSLFPSEVMAHGTSGSCAIEKPLSAVAGLEQPKRSNDEQDQRDDAKSDGEMRDHCNAEREVLDEGEDDQHHANCNQPDGQVPAHDILLGMIYTRWLVARRLACAVGLPHISEVRPEASLHHQMFGADTPRLRAGEEASSPFCSKHPRKSPKGDLFGGNGQTPPLQVAPLGVRFPSTKFVSGLSVSGTGCNPVCRFNH